MLAINGSQCKHKMLALLDGLHLARSSRRSPRRINEVVKSLRGITVDTEHTRVAMADLLGRIVRRELADASGIAHTYGACSALLGVARTGSKILFKIDVQL